MRVLLRHTRSGLYFQSPDKWTADPELALDLRFMDRASRFAETWGLRGVELAVAVDLTDKIRTVGLTAGAVRQARGRAV